MLKASSQQWLLKLARDSIQAQCSQQSLPIPENIPDDVLAKSGCFVSLHTKAGQLRGCIGTFSEDTPLWQCVQQFALNAAFKDPRFRPLTAQELEHCDLEISVLSPRKPATGLDDIIVGKHGLWVSASYYSGVLLPQVAVEQGWDKETFLSETCMKAGLPAQAWQTGKVNIQTFEAEIFKET